MPCVLSCGSGIELLDRRQESASNRMRNKRSRISDMHIRGRRSRSREPSEKSLGAVGIDLVSAVGFSLSELNHDDEVLMEIAETCQGKISPRLLVNRYS